MGKIKLGSHVGMSGKDMFLGSVREAAGYGANVLMLYTGAPQNSRRKDISKLNIDAGYDLVSDYEGVMRRFDETVGLDQIAVIHVNDSLNPCGSHKDRHANIGKGTIGFESLWRIVHDERFSGIPKILETPYLPEEGSKNKTIPPYKEEIRMLLSDNI